MIGVYGTAADNSQLDLIFNRNVQVKSGQAPVIHMMPNLYDMIKIKVFDPTEIITHTMPLKDVKEVMISLIRKKIIMLKSF